MTADNFCFYIQNKLIQTSQAGGQWYSDYSPFSIPCTQHNVIAYQQKCDIITTMISECYPKCLYNEFRYAKFHYGDCHYAECRYTESRGAKIK